MVNRRMAEIYVSTDVECDGPIPGPHSMLSFASAAFDAQGERLATFSANLETLPDAHPHPATMEWWEDYPHIWQQLRSQLQAPAVVMPAYAAWLHGLPGRPLFIGYPAAFDFMFIYWYLMRFHGESPFGHNALDIRSYGMAMLKKDYFESGKESVPGHWLSTHPHTHHALDDAIEQGELFIHMLRENLDAR